MRGEGAREREGDGGREGGRKSEKRDRLRRKRRGKVSENS